MAESFRFSERADMCLRAAGWQPGREVDISQFVEQLERFKIAVPEAARAFLTEFAYLKIRVPYGGPLTQLEVHTSTLLFGVTTSPDFLPDVEARIHEKAIPIGEYAYAVLLMGESGHVFSCFDDFLYFLGDSGDEAIETLFSGSPGNPVTNG